MEKNKLIQRIILTVITLTLIAVTSCKKNNDYKKLLGTWISTDLVDTINFTSEHDFYKMFSGFNDHFDYFSSDEIITIRYNGINKIAVLPTTHPYQINGNDLTIDFRPNCYGFRAQEIKFIKK
jgi:hypothetical protein